MSFEDQRQAELIVQHSEASALLCQEGAISQILSMPETTILRAAAYALRHHDGEYFWGNEVAKALEDKNAFPKLSKFESDYGLLTVSRAQNPETHQIGRQYAPTELGRKVFALFVPDIDAD